MTRSLRTIPVLAVLGALAACGSASTSATGGAATTTVNPAVALASAGQLHAHLGGPGGTEVLCDPDSAHLTTRTNGHLGITITYDGPALLRASVTTTDGQVHALKKIISAEESGYTFDLAGYRSADIRKITVSLNADGQDGTCVVMDNGS
jgi:hypothetical protein